MASFDPYHKWLCIPADQQPASHYRLLGVEECESDLEVIETAAERQTIYLRTFQTGPNAELAERLLNEVSEARVCLLDGKSKAKYDARLNARPRPPAPPVTEPVPPALVAKPTGAIEQPSKVVKASQRATESIKAKQQLPKPVVSKPASDESLPPIVTSQQIKRVTTGPLLRSLPWVVCAAAVGVVVVVVIMIMQGSADREKQTLPKKKSVSSKPAEVREDEPVKIWNTLPETVREIRTLKGHTAGVRSVRFNQDGKRIVSGSSDKSLKVWDTENGDAIKMLKGHSGHVMCVAFSPDGKRIVSGGGESGKPGEIKVWDLKTGGEALTLKGHTNQIGSVAFSPEGKRIVSGGYDATVRLWDAQTGKQSLTLRGHVDAVHSVLFSSDGKRLVSGSTDKTLRVWDAGTGKLQLTLRGHTHRVLSVAFSPDGKQIVSGSEDHTVRVWDAETGQEILELKGHSGLVREVAFSPDGKWVVSGAYDATLKLWDSKTGRMVRTLKGHAGSVYSVAFSPDGRRIVSSSADQTIKVWSLESSFLTGSSKLPAPSLQKDLVAHYPLNGDAQDVSGNGHHGLLKGVVPTVDHHGVAKGAYSFRGGEYISLPPFRYGAKFTISIWASLPSEQRQQFIFSKKPRPSVNSVQFFIFERQYYVRVFQSDNVAIGRMTPVSSTPSGTWMHLAVTYDGGNTPSALRIYKDGERIDKVDYYQGKGSFTKFNDLMENSELGSQNSGAETIQGSLDDLRIYKRALPEAEVKRLYEDK